MARRKKVNRSRSKKMFTRNAVKTHGRNNYSPMRGGIRL
jgi:hypothetical protein